MATQQPLQFHLMEFNPRRNMRGAPAARVEVIDGDDSYWLWMDRADLRKNIEEHGAHPELVKAQQAYATGKAA